MLKRQELSRIVAGSLLHFDGKRYPMGDFVVMPNHVHLVACLIGSTDVVRQCYSWKKFTAAIIHGTLGCRGRFWQAESFDHLVRSPDEFEPLRRYIAENPLKADDGEQWTVPLGGGGGKIFRIGKQAMNAQAQFFRYIESPSIGPDEWAVRVQFQLLFPKKRK